MSVQNLAIVFGPTLFSGALTAMADTSLQNRVRAAPRLIRVLCAMADVLRRPSRRSSSTTPTYLWTTPRTSCATQRAGCGTP